MTAVLGDGTVEFRFYRPDARMVHIVGEFNSWLPGVNPMRSNGDGWWVATIPLDPGEYRFRYVADGIWYTDYAANGIEASANGWNTILLIPAPRQLAVGKIGRNRELVEV